MGFFQKHKVLPGYFVNYVIRNLVLLSLLILLFCMTIWVLKMIILAAFLSNFYKEYSKHLLTNTKPINVNYELVLGESKDSTKEHWIWRELNQIREDKIYFLLTVSALTISAYTTGLGIYNAFDVQVWVAVVFTIVIISALAFVMSQFQKGKLSLMILLPMYVLFDFASVSSNWFFFYENQKTNTQLDYVINEVFPELLDEIETVEAERIYKIKELEADSTWLINRIMAIDEEISKNQEITKSQPFYETTKEFDKKKNAPITKTTLKEVFQITDTRTINALNNPLRNEKDSLNANFKKTTVELGKLKGVQAENSKLDKTLLFNQIDSLKYGSRDEIKEKTPNIKRSLLSLSKQDSSLQSLASKLFFPQESVISAIIDFYTSLSLKSMRLFLTPQFLSFLGILESKPFNAESNGELVIQDSLGLARIKVDSLDSYLIDSVVENHDSLALSRTDVNSPVIIENASTKNTENIFWNEKKLKVQYSSFVVSVFVDLIPLIMGLVVFYKNRKK